MNDLEKAREIADGYSTDSQGMMPIRMVKQEIKQSCLEMAQWKDEQFKEQLSSLKDEIQSNLCVSSGFNDKYSQGYQDCGIKVIEMIDKILKNV